jgi:hypothetical protein
MGLRFRKSVSFGRLLRLNFSVSGVSLGVGPPGLNVNFGSRGLRKTIGIPGTGVSYQTFSKWQAEPDKLQAAVSTSNTGATESSYSRSDGSRSKGRLAWIAVIAVFGLIGVALNSKPETSVPQAANYQVTPPTEKPKMPVVASNSSQQTPSPAPLTPSEQKAEQGPLNQDEVREVQTWLKAYGLDPGPIDGLPGPLTTAAIKKYELARQKVQTGALDPSLLEILRRDVGRPIR